MDASNLQANSHYIVFSHKRIFCPPAQDWRLLSGAEVARQDWQLNQLVPLFPGRPDLQVIDVTETASSDTGAWLSLRDLLLRVDGDAFKQLGTAAQVLEWAQNHRFCGRCGAATAMQLHERSLQCTNCGLTHYPRVSPCIITLVTRGDEVLLARSRRYSVPMYSCLAGFIEAGESAEEAVHREVLEEANVRVQRLRYQHSQSWPFPHQLMLGYLADYESGELRIDEEELADAQWFPLHALPMTPPPQTIAGQLIQAYRQERQTSP